MRALVACSIVLFLARPALATDGSLRRFAVVAGASLGGPGRTPLRYATADARDVSRVLRRLGGVALGDLVLLEEPDANRIRSALAGVAAEVERAHAAGRRVELFLYYSGHSDEEGLLLGGSRLSYVDLRQALDAAPADVRVAILDSCASGAFTRAKGGVHRPPFLVDESNRVQGHAFLTSSAANEAAQESDRLRGSFFTHALLTGLRGAADASGDGVVTLNEAYQFAFRETLAGTEATQGGPQHATYDIGLVGSGDVVMTDLRNADALLILPANLDGRVFVHGPRGQLVAELRKVRGARVDLALEEGRYEVRITREQRILGGTFELVASGRVVVEEAQLSELAREPTTARGDLGGPPAIPAPLAPAPEPAPSLATGRYTLLVRAGPAISLRPGSPKGLQAEVAAEAWLAGIVGFEVASGYGRISGQTKGRLPGLWGGIYQSDVDDDVTIAPALLTVKLGFPANPVRPYLLGGAGLYFVRVDRRPGRDYAWIVPGTEKLSDDDTFVAFHAGAGAAIQISPRAFASVEARYSFGDAYVLQEKTRMDAVRVSAGVGYRF